MDFKQTAVVDFDGTIATYDKWEGEDVYGELIPDAKSALEELKVWGWRIIVFTTRGNDDGVVEWLKSNKVPFDGVNSTDHNPPGTSHKPIGMVYFDDRDAHVVGKKPYNWVKAMKRVRRLYQPRPLDLFIDDASVWSSLTYRLMEWYRKRGVPSKKYI